MPSNDNKIVILDQLSPDSPTGSRFHIYTPERIGQLSLTELNDYLRNVRMWASQYENVIRSEIRIKARQEDPHYDDIPF